ncbi:hypothetical protein BO70DRAFT_383324 [Aspergillus heteromorphus CBS 117.55]|uniref:CWH43-like N-terminal domain-containing protein n=1 Tax=Aspergillus heteromorphus CBS 117.55 TaxID=1448321 RepID=A0A317UTF4_9EURO|nr:uncharacterized protein BO70DRAFT_383324 [Aspergillus heteromorphus CBS 117.55]PWY65304.1 hypothetical protein BO70DRAFT_383324 [Aspergillus heteromorphus CBS 117.55]
MITALLLRGHDSVWASLHAVILNIPPSRLRIFPFLAGLVWFLTLSALLLTWLGRGMPKYPGQSNPHVAFISDIASFELKPLFLVGASMTAVGFLFTVAAVHVVRYEPGFALVRCPHPDNENTPPSLHDPENNNTAPDIHRHITPANEDEDEDEDECEDLDTLKTLKVISLFSIFASGMASTALILLGVMDTFRYKYAHHIFLRICFGGLAIQSAGTAIVYSNEVLSFASYLYHWGMWQHNWGKRSLRVRVFASLSTILILIQLFLGVAFISLTVPEDAHDYRTAGIIEWIIAFLGTIYLWLFCGFFDRTNFDGYIYSVLYESAANGKLPIRGPLSGVAGSSHTERDSERAPLLSTASGTGRYT